MVRPAEDPRWIDCEMDARFARWEGRPVALIPAARSWLDLVGAEHDAGEGATILAGHVLNLTDGIWRFHTPHVLFAVPSGHRPPGATHDRLLALLVAYAMVSARYARFRQNEVRFNALRDRLRSVEAEIGKAYREMAAYRAMDRRPLHDGTTAHTPRFIDLPREARDRRRAGAVMVGQ